MPLPATWTQVPIIWSPILGHNATPCNGKVKFVATQVVTCAGGTYVPEPITAEVVDGVMEAVSLPSTDDADISPTGWTWRVIPQLAPDGPLPFDITVPAAGGTINLATVVPVGTPAPVTPTQYVPLSQRGTAGGVATLDGSTLVPDAQIPASIARDSEVTAAQAAVQANLDAHLSDTSDAHDASAVSFAPTGTVAATDVQAAIAEIATEYAAADAAHVAAADPHAVYARKAAANTFTGAQTVDTAGAQVYLHRNNGTADARRFGLWTETDGTLRFYPASDAGAANGTPVIFGRDGSIHQNAGGPKMMTGSGSPEGVTTAPVGSRYVDTAATRGAVEWIKATGAGNTGWRVVYGDTGWRNLAPANGWTGTVLIRRVNGLVHLKLHALTATGATSGIFFDTSNLVGFRAGTAAGATLGRWLAHRTDMTLRRVFGMTEVSAWVAADVLYGEFTCTTDDNWPTTLPGTAA